MARTKALIPWDQKPATVTTETFKRIKDYVLSLKESTDTNKVILTPAELQHMHPGVLFTDSLYNALVACVQRRYRDNLTLADLPDPAFARESADTLAELIEKELSARAYYDCDLLDFMSS